MPKFTSIEELFTQAEQSIINSPATNGVAELGTFTLNDRGAWEDNNFNENTLEPYLTDNKSTLKTTNVNIETETGNNINITYLPSIETSPTYQYSIDALPYVLDINNENEIIRLDKYYNKDEESDKYNLASEGKINYYIYPRASGRNVPNSIIDNYQERGLKTADFGKNRFDVLAKENGDTGYYLFKLNWGDGTEIEYTDNPKLLESSVLLNHTYKKPGFYTISGIVYALYSPNSENQIGGYERFETNILLNPSQNYELNLYNYDNFATIGGISKDSVLAKSAVNLIGINPLDFNDNTRASSKVIEKVNLLDKLELLNFINKFLPDNLNQFEDILDIQFTNYIYPLPFDILGCMDTNAINYNGDADADDPDNPCQYNQLVNVSNPNDIEISIYKKNPNTEWSSALWQGFGGITSDDDVYKTAFEEDSYIDPIYTIESISNKVVVNNPLTINEIIESETFLIVNIPSFTNEEIASVYDANNYFQLTPILVSSDESRRDDGSINSFYFKDGWFKLEYTGPIASSTNYNDVTIQFLQGDEPPATYTLTLNVSNHSNDMEKPYGAILLNDDSSAQFNSREVQFTAGDTIMLEAQLISPSNYEANYYTQPEFLNWSSDTLDVNESLTSSQIDFTINRSHTITANFSEPIYSPILNIPTLEQPEHIAIDLSTMWFGNPTSTSPNPESVQIPSVDVQNLSNPWNINIRFFVDTTQTPNSLFTNQTFNWSAHVVWFSQTDNEWKDEFLDYQDYVNGVNNGLSSGAYTMTIGDTRATGGNAGNEYELSNWQYALNLVKNSTQPTPDIFYYVQVQAGQSMIRSTLGRILNLFSQGSYDAPIFGCMDPTANNYDSNATHTNTSCDYSGWNLSASSTNLNGTVSINTEYNVDGENRFLNNTFVSIQVTPQPGYMFERWVGDDIDVLESSTDSNPSFQITKNTVISAVFMMEI